MKILKTKVMANNHVQPKNFVVSSKANNRKAVMAGAGSGITLDVGSISFDTIQDYSFKGNTLVGTAIGTVEVIYIGTYYDGERLEKECPCEIEFTLEDDSLNLEDSINEYGIEDVLTSLEYDQEAQIGGGWTRSTFDGTFSIDCWDYDTSGSFAITITDAEFVSYMDKAAHGDNVYTDYEVFVDDEPTEDVFDNQSDAIKKAEEYDTGDNEVAVRMAVWREDFNGDADLDYAETVWTNQPEDDYYEPDYDE